MNHISESIIPERVTLACGTSIYVSIDPATKKIFTCIAPAVEADPRVIVHLAQPAPTPDVIHALSYKHQLSDRFVGSNEEITEQLKAFLVTFRNDNSKAYSISLSGMALAVFCDVSRSAE